jgi:hypothetical protein
MEIKFALPAWVVISLLGLIFMIIQHLLNWWYRWENKRGGYYDDGWMAIFVDVIGFIVYSAIIYGILQK